MKQDAETNAGHAVKKLFQMILGKFGFSLVQEGMVTRLTQRIDFLEQEIRTARKSLEMITAKAKSVRRLTQRIDFLEQELRKLAKPEIGRMFDIIKCMDEESNEGRNVHPQFPKG